MTQNNFRKEPTFGEPSVTNQAETANEAAKVAPSLHSTTAPAQTFTPQVKRPEAAATEAVKVEEVKKVEPSKPAGFTFEPVVEKAEKVAVEAESAVKNAAESAKSTAQEAVKVATAAVERVIPNSAPNKPEATPAVTASKGRRLGLVALLAAILGAVFFWLKPSTPETVEELQQQQGGNLPIEFRPVDEAEAQRAEAQAQAEREAAAQQAQQTAQPAQATETAPQATQQPAQPVATPEPMTQTPAVETPAATTETATVQPEPQTEVVKAVAPVKPEVQKPKTQGSVIHQAEHKPAKQPHIKAMTADEFNAKKSKNAQMDQLVKNVESGKTVPKTAPAPVAKPATKPASAATTNTASATPAVTTKTMTVPKSTSLMQVFRDNQLNISDVNAMNKVNSIVSKLKENEKVTVRLDKNNRVVEMSIGSGGKFTRQADGSYTFK